MKKHKYEVQVQWTGNLGRGTSGYQDYDRAHTIAFEGKPPILCSSDVAFRGDPHRNNPEELLVSALSSCHMLWYLHLCSDNGIIVQKYTDRARGTMIEHPDGSGRFTEVVLFPEVVISAGDAKKAMALHDQANKLCFIARSCNFPVHHHTTISLV